MQPPSAQHRKELLYNAIDSLNVLNKDEFGVVKVNEQIKKSIITIEFIRKDFIITVEIPNRGEDGGYMISLPGDASFWLKNGIDRIAYQYGYHRISNENEHAKLTHEWLDSENFKKALGAVYILQAAIRLNTGG